MIDSFQHWCAAWSWATLCSAGVVLFTERQFPIFVAFGAGIVAAWILQWVRLHAWARGLCLGDYQPTGIVQFLGWLAVVATIAAAIGWEALSQAQEISDGWTRNVETSLMKDAAWLKKSFTDAFHKVKDSDPESLKAVPDPEAGGNRLPITKDSSSAVEKVYEYAVKEYIGDQYPWLSDFTDAALSQDSINTGATEISQDPDNPLINRTVHASVHGIGGAVRFFVEERRIIWQLQVVGTALAFQALSFLAITLSAWRRAFPKIISAEFLQPRKKT